MKLQFQVVPIVEESAPLKTISQRFGIDLNVVKASSGMERLTFLCLPKRLLATYANIFSSVITLSVNKNFEKNAGLDDFVGYFNFKSFLNCARYPFSTGLRRSSSLL